MSKNVNYGKSRASGFYNRYVKRFLDIFVCLVGLLLFGWVFAFVALLVQIGADGT